MVPIITSPLSSSHSIWFIMITVKVGMGEFSEKIKRVGWVICNISPKKYDGGGLQIVWNFSKKTHPFWHLVHNNVQKCYMSCISVTKCYNIIITWSIATGRGIVSENFSIPSSCLVISYFYSRESKFTNCLTPTFQTLWSFCPLGHWPKLPFHSPIWSALKFVVNSSSSR